MSICDDAIAYMRESNDADAQNRQEGLEDLRFSLGDMWDVTILNQRHLEHRPHFTINEIDAFVRQISNQIRQQRPRGKAHGINTSSDAKTAQVITGIVRHIEELSDADNAYDIAVEFAIRMGWGYYRLTGEYGKDDTFDQDICVRPIYNPFSVSFDPYSHAPDGSDQTRCLVSDFIRKEVFRQLYPDADEQNFTYRSVGDHVGEWLDKDSIRVAEYFEIDRERRKLVHLTDDSAWWDDEVPDSELLKKAGISVKGDRISWRKKIRWYKITALQVLEERTLPGRFIPIVPVYGGMIQMDGKIRRFGIVRQAKDPQRMLNYWQTAITEMVALAAKAKWVGAAAAFDGFEREWEQANVVAYPMLKFNHMDEAGNPIPEPTRQAPEPPPQGAMAAAQIAHENLQRVLGMFDPATRPSNANVSGRALNAEQQQSDMSNFHMYDNLTRSMKHGYRIMLDWIPAYYGKKRILRIIGEDRKPQLVTLNDWDQVAQKIKNDMTIGTYDIVMETGPGYNSKRQEAVESMAPLLAGPNNPLMQVAGDLFFRNMDFPGADIIADRLAAANPLAQIDDKSDIPPRIQILIKQLKKQIQEQGQQLQSAGLIIKQKKEDTAEKEMAETHRLQIKEAGETQRAHLKAQTEITRELIEDRTWNQDIARREQGKLGVAEIDGMVKLLLAHKESQLKQIEIAANREENELERAAARANGSSAS